MAWESLKGESLSEKWMPSLSILVSSLIFMMDTYIEVPKHICRSVNRNGLKSENSQDLWSHTKFILVLKVGSVAYGLYSQEE